MPSRSLNERLRRASIHFPAVACIGLALYFADTPAYDPPIRSDGFGYHLWLRAWSRGSNDFCDEREFDKYYAHVKGSILPPSPLTGRCGNIYPPGVALAKAPFLLGRVQKNPERAPNRKEQKVTSALPLFLMAIAWECLLLVLVRAGVAPSNAVLALLVSFFGTGYFHYASFDAGFSHAYSAFWVSVAIYGVSRRSPWGLVLSGVAASMLVLTRTTNILLLPAIAVACAALEGLSVRRMVSLTLLLGSLALPGWLVQVALNSWFAGALTLSSYGTFGKFQFSLHYVSDIFVSYERGLFSYYPGFALMFGVALLVSRTRTAMAMICAGALGAAVLYSSWLLWQLGAGFGHRGFVELAPIAGVLFALALGGVRSTLQPWLAFLGVLSIYLCTLLMLGYWRALNQANLYWNHLRGEHLSLQANAGLVLACVATWWWLSRWLGAAGSRISVAGDEHA